MSNTMKVAVRLAPLEKLEKGAKDAALPLESYIFIW